MLILLNHRSMQTCHCACSTRGPVITQKPLYRCCFSNNNYSTLANFAEMWILVRFSCHKAQWHFADTSPRLVTRPQARLLFFNASILETTSLLFSLSSVNRGLNMIFPKPFFLFFSFFLIIHDSKLLHWNPGWNYRSENGQDGTLKHMKAQRAMTDRAHICDQAKIPNSPSRSIWSWCIMKGAHFGESPPCLPHWPAWGCLTLSLDVWLPLWIMN